MPPLPPPAGNRLQEKDSAPEETKDPQPPVTPGPRLSVQDLEALFPGGNPALATIGEDTIRASELAGPLFAHFGSQGEEILRKLVGDVIARREAREYGITLDQNEVDQAVREGMETLANQVDLQYGGKRTLEEILREDFHTSLAGYQRGIRRFVMNRLFFERALRLDLMGEERVVCRVITVKEEGKAQELLTRIQEGADFQVLARQESLAPSAQEGGKLPPFGPRYEHAITAPAFRTPLGEVAGPLRERTPEGDLYHLIRVIEKLPPRRGSYADLEAEIRSGLAESPVAEWEYFYWSRKMEKSTKYDSSNGPSIILGMTDQEQNEPQVDIPKPPSLMELPLEERRRAILAQLFAVPEVLPLSRIAEGAGNVGGKQARALLEETQAWIEECKLPFKIAELGGGFRLLTLPEFEPHVRGLQKISRKEKLTQAALETLSIIAYRQPIMKAEIEAIRGVQAGPLLRNLIEKRLVKVAGRAKVPGRPLQYGTTPTFLDRFGLKSIDELPTLEELRQN